MAIRRKTRTASKTHPTGKTPVQPQKNVLHDPRLTPVQRQALAQRIHQTYGNRYLQRLLAASPATIQRKGETFAQAKSMADYVALVKAAELKFPKYSPRKILAMLRQVYYGKSWSTRRTKQWQDVLPKSPSLGDPRGRLGTGHGSLFAALQGSQVIGKTDIGHLLTGLEALLDPQKSVQVQAPGPDPVVKMPNTEFATWGGDLGSAAGQMVADHFNKVKLKSPQEYFTKMASEEDLEGDIDAFVVNKAAGQKGGLGSLLGVGAKKEKGMKVSDLLKKYYLTPGSEMGKAHEKRYEIFVKLIGGSVKDKKISNKSTLINSLSKRVTEFGYVWVLKEVHKKTGKTEAAALWGREGLLKSVLMPMSKIMTRLFLNWLESQMQST